MKCYFILREDIDFSSDRLMKTALHGASLIENNFQEWKTKSKSEILMIFNMNFLYKLEARLIEDGIFFKWIEEYNTILGILIEPTEKQIIPEYLSDCLTLKEYAVFRQKLYNELALERAKEEKKHDEENKI